MTESLRLTFTAGAWDLLGQYTPGMYEYVRTVRSSTTTKEDVSINSRHHAILTDVGETASRSLRFLQDMPLSRLQKSIEILAIEVPSSPAIVYTEHQ